MKDVRFLASAQADLRDIDNYYRNIDPDVAARILKDIESAIAFLKEHPRMGRPTQQRGVRGKLSRRYRYRIVYRVTRNAVVIIGIYRFQNRST